MSNYHDLLEKAKWSKLTDAEVGAVARELQREKPDTDRYTLLHILGRAGATAHRGLVERYLDVPDDPMLARIALQTLIDYWDLADEYLAVTKRFVHGVAWDVDQDVRLVAISNAGEYLRTHEEPELLGEILRIFNDDREMRMSRETAYRALARATGRPWKELPSAASHFDLQHDIDPRVIAEATRRAPASR